jgi:hypothetical protein
MNCPFSIDGGAQCQHLMMIVVPEKTAGLTSEETATARRMADPNDVKAIGDQTLSAASMTGKTLLECCFPANARFPPLADQPLSTHSGRSAGLAAFGRYPCRLATMLRS